MRKGGVNAIFFFILEKKRNIYFNISINVIVTIFTGSENDVDKLRELFQSTFKFHVECESDLTKDGLKETLTDVRDSYMKTARQAKQYYCFVCVVMSHGDEVSNFKMYNELTYNKSQNENKQYQHKVP